MPNVFNIYLKKINSKRSADILVYKYEKQYWDRFTFQTHIIIFF